MTRPALRVVPLPVAAEQLAFDFDLPLPPPAVGALAAAGPTWPAAPAGDAPPGTAWAGPSPAARPPSSAHPPGDPPPGAAWADPSATARPPSSAHPPGDPPPGAAWAGPSAPADAEWARPDRPPPAGAPPAPWPATTLEARRAAARFATLCLEVLTGFRPAGHVRPLANPGDASRVVDRLVVANHRLGRRRPGHHPSDLVKLRLLRVSEPRPGVVEAAASLGTSQRAWAMAFRLEQGAPNRWLGTALEVI